MDRPKTVGKKRRHCPALNAPISAAECGSQRGSRLACPDDCPFFPFGTQAEELWQHLLGEWTNAALEFLRATVGHEEIQTLLRQHRPPHSHDEDSEFEASLNQVILLQLFMERDSEGRTRVEAWEAAGYPGLNNDQRVMTRYRRHTRATVIELERQLTPHTSLWRDLFEPDRPPFPIFHKHATLDLPRFSRLLILLTHYPHHARVTLPIAEIPLHIAPEWEARIRAEHAAAAASQPGLSLKDYLSRSMLQAMELADQLARTSLERMVNQMDLCQCLAAYQCLVPRAEIEAALQQKPEFHPETPQAEAGIAQPLAAFRWLATGESAALEQELAALGPAPAPAQGELVVGVVRLYPERLVVETHSRLKHAFARRLLERYLEGRIAFDRETQVDLAQVLRDQRREQVAVDVAQQVLFTDAEPEPERSAAPPPPSLPADQAEAARQEHERATLAWLDDPTPDLGGLTPRTAAANPARRPEVRDLLKRRLQNLDRRNREQGTDFNLDPVLDTLGFPELK